MFRINLNPYVWEIGMRNIRLDTLTFRTTILESLFFLNGNWYIMRALNCVLIRSTYTMANAAITFINTVGR